MVQIQLNVYTLALPDILTYVTAALRSVTCIEPAPNPSRSIRFPQLFDASIQQCKFFFCICFFHTIKLFRSDMLVFFFRTHIEENIGRTSNYIAFVSG